VAMTMCEKRVSRLEKQWETGEDDYWYQEYLNGNRVIIAQKLAKRPLERVVKGGN